MFVAATYPTCLNDTLQCLTSMPLTDEELEQLARQEILRETKLCAERAKEHGAYGWQKPRIRPTNKNFLRNTLLSTLADRRRESGAARAPERASNEGSAAAANQAASNKSRNAKQPTCDANTFPKECAPRKTTADRCDRKRTHDGVRKNKL